MSTRYFLASYKGNGNFTDRLIRFGTRSSYSHCELVYCDEVPNPGETHSCISASGRDGGVRVKDVTFKPGNWDFTAVPWAPADAWDRIAEHVGKRYDYVGILFSQVFNFKRNDAKKWFCSEICAMGLGFDVPQHYSPGDLKRVAEEHNRTYAFGQTPPSDTMIT